MAPKTSTLVIGTKSQGGCETCRHANQGTADFAEGHAFCWIDKHTKQRAQRCDVELRLPKSSKEPVARWEAYFMYEAFDGANGTYDRATDLRMLAEDAEPALQHTLRAHVPVEG